MFSELFDQVVIPYIFFLASITINWWVYDFGVKDNILELKTISKD